MEKLIDEKKIEQFVINTISQYLSEDYLRGFIAKIVASALNSKENSYDSETIIEKGLKRKILSIAKEELEKELDNNKERIRQAVRKILDEKGIDIIIDRITKLSAQKIAEAIKIEAWLEE